MGVEHYIVCDQCKQYIDLHKAYGFSSVINNHRPPVGIECKETGFNDPKLYGGYWDARGLWFIWEHRGHSGIRMATDCADSWYDEMPYLKEVYPHYEDLKIRDRVSKTKKEPSP